MISEEKVESIKATLLAQRDYELNSLIDYAKRMVTYGEEADKFIKDVKSNNGYYISFFDFAKPTTEKAIESIARLNTIQNSINMLEFITREG